MKELSIEEKAKAYDEALKQIKECTPDENGFVTIYPNEIFPTLRESEDERIRKRMLQGFKDYNEPEYEWCKGVKVKECITWLEKQGESIEINPSEFDLRLNRLLKQFETLSKEELESSLSFYLNVIQNDGTYKNKKPKFEAGNWITNGEFVWLISNVGDFDYEVISPKGECVTDTISHVDEYFHLWSVKNAKSGDVLVSTWKGHQYIYIFKNIEHNAIISYIYYYPELDAIDMGVINMDNTPTVPATKEQQELLFSKIKDEGYKWDDTEKLTVDVVSMNQNSSSITKQNLTWSEEDCDKISSIRYLLHELNNYNFDNWLDSLKYKPQYNKLSWSEEDEKMFIDALDMIEWYGGSHEERSRKTSDWLKSLKNRIQSKQNACGEEQNNIISMMKAHCVKLT